ncbi:uncharacterized protein LOC110020125 [Phalaenopsis equestris]|uniref:uncharacterized protein LOC110020125 n=1 Tax=Phalaenopsis equestris TaxID=78828 RepID=UPI0009E1F532|nr:uncharacterized protein LOC110020125 [Phalaenopsis equestris]XP_020573774.1 uncharacterized protein LOC110020125 [Phalaenopsis equestris]
MAYIYKPVYYSSFQDTLTSLCKSILPFSFKSRLLQADQKQAKRHAENLKWQQDSFHRILHLIGLHNEGIVPEAEVSAFRSHLLETLIASPTELELPTIIRDKLLFLRELLLANCISSDEYHFSKRPLLQRLAAQGTEIDSRDVVVGSPPLLKNSEEEWSDIDLNDQEPPKTIEKAKEKTHLKLPWRAKVKKDETNTKKTVGIVMQQSLPLIATTKYETNKRKPFHALFQKEKQDDDSESKNLARDCEERGAKYSKKQWGFEGLKKWKRSSCEDDSMKSYLFPGERSDDASLSNQCKLVSSPIGEGPDTKRIKKKIHSDGSSSDFFIDKVLGENIKKELSRIQSELSATNQNLNFSDDQMEAISMKLPVDKADLNKFFPKSWCSTYGDIVLDVVKKEFKDHVGEMENLRNASKPKPDSFKENWVTFNTEYENFHPNLFSPVQLTSNQQRVKDNPFIEGHEDVDACNVSKNPFIQVQNPFWPPKWDN